MSENLYDFDAGDLSLDFANTTNWHGSDHPEDMLGSYTALLTWGKQAGLLTLDATKRMHELAEAQPNKVDHLYERAIQVREAIYRIFSRRYAGKPISKRDLVLLNSLVREAMTHRQLVQSSDGFNWAWTPDLDGINQILLPVAFAAAHLLASPMVSRVRECEDDRGCGYLFIDLSKNHSRRWCSMESCGNRAKARRHYSRTQA